MTIDERIKAIEDRLELASPEPWQHNGRYAVMAADRDEPYRRVKVADCQQQDNAAFIAGARSDVPWLINELARAREALAGAKLQHQYRCATNSNHVGQVCSLGVMHVGVAPKCDCDADEHNARIDAALAGKP